MEPALFKEIVMIKNDKRAAGLVLIPLALGLAVPAFAENNVNETQALMNAKISIADAIRAAEAEVNGKAIDSGLNDGNGDVSYQVEVVAPNGKRTDVFVDLQTGKVLKMAAADDDEKGENGENDGNNENDENDGGNGDNDGGNDNNGGGNKNEGGQENGNN